MEFQKFWEEKNRMCKSFKICSECLMRKEVRRKNRLDFDTELTKKTLCDLLITENPKTAEKVVEKWAAENPVMTNGQKFCEVFGVDLLVLPVYKKNEPRIHIKGMPFEEWLQAEYKPPQEV